MMKDSTSQIKSSQINTVPLFELYDHLTDYY